MQSTIQYIKNELAPIYPQSEIDGFTRIIFETVLNFSYTDIVLKKHSKINDEVFGQIKTIVDRLKTHEPIQYIIGECDFCGLRLNVNSAVLIPRPETEELVELIKQSKVQSGAKILDIGTGSGCIPLALKNELPNTEVYGLDISEEALEVAKGNAIKNKLQVDFFRADILNWEKYSWQQYNVIVSNPPYVRDSERKLMDSNVLEYEPDGALFVKDSDPLIFYKTIAEFGIESLASNGQLFFEINEYLGAEMVDFLKAVGYSDVELHQDINGKDRMVSCVKAR